MRGENPREGNPPAAGPRGGDGLPTSLGGGRGGLGHGGVTKGGGMHMGGMNSLHRERDLSSGGASSHVFGLGGLRSRGHYGHFEGGAGSGGRSGSSPYDRDAFQKLSLPAIGGGGAGAYGHEPSGGGGGGDSWGVHSLGGARGMRGGRFTSRGGGGLGSGTEDANLPSMQGGFWKHSPKGSSFDAFPTSTKPRTPYASHGSRPMTRESRPTTRERLDMVLDLRPPMTSHGGYHGGGVGGGDHHHHHHSHHHHVDGEDEEQGGWNARDAPLKREGRPCGRIWAGSRPKATRASSTGINAACWEGCASSEVKGRGKRSKGLAWARDYLFRDCSI